MRLSLNRGAVMIAAIVGLGALCLSSGEAAAASETEARAALQAGDYTKAIQELQPLADQGDAEAQYLLAETYFGGHGGNTTDALKWMTASARQGYVQAQARLGLLYATGRGVPLNNVEAYRWFAIAAKLADPKTQKNLKTVSETNRNVVARRLNADERAKVDTEVASWGPGGAAPQPTVAAAPSTVAKIGQVIPGIRIQLAAVKSEDEANKEWARLQHALGDALTGLALTVESVDLGAKGTFYRVQGGPFSDKATAAAKCETIKGLKQDCLVIVRK
jgi:hypothetical protein